VSIPTTIAAATPLAAPAEPKPGVAVKTVALAAVEPAPEAPRVEKAASPDMAQFVTLASAYPSFATIQKASFTSAPPTTLQTPPSAPERVAAAPPPQSRLLSTATAATQTCKRLARAGGGWVWRRVELALGREGSPPHSQSAPIRQAELS
jgi:hypothetical protein